MDTSNHSNLLVFLHLAFLLMFNRCTDDNSMEMMTTTNREEANPLTALPILLEVTQLLEVAEVEDVVEVAVGVAGEGVVETTRRREGEEAEDGRRIDKDEIIQDLALPVEIPLPYLLTLLQGHPLSLLQETMETTLVPPLIPEPAQKHFDCS